MRLRRVFSITAALVFLAGMLFSGTALAYGDAVGEESVKIGNVSVSPSSLTGDGTVNLSFSVSLDSNAVDSISGLRLSKGEAALSLNGDGTVQPGQESGFSCELPVSSSELGKSISLTLKWGGYSAQESKSFSVKVNSAAPAEPQVKFTRTIDRTSAAPGETVTLEYTVENTGSVAIENLKITDGGVSDMSQERSSLGAGSSASFSHKVTMDGSFTSSPKLTYQANGKTYTKTVSSAKVSMKTAELKAVLEASSSSVKSGDEVTLVCTLSNTGDVKLTSITMSDDTLGSKLFSTSSLNAGSSKSFSKTVTLTKTTNFQYTITAKDESGKSYTFKSNSEQVKVSESSGEEGGQKLDLSLDASSDALQLTQPGTVNFEIIVKNNGASDVANARVIDQDGNTIETFNTLTPGSHTVNYQTTVQTDTVFTFSLVVDGESGQTTVSSGPLEVKVTNDVVTDPSASPEATASVEPTPTDTAVAASAGAAGGLSATMIALVVVGILIVITTIVLISMIAKDRKRRKAKQKELRRMRLQEGNHKK